MGNIELILFGLFFVAVRYVSFLYLLPELFNFPPRFIHSFLFFLLSFPFQSFLHLLISLVLSLSFSLALLRFIYSSISHPSSLSLSLFYFYPLSYLSFSSSLSILSLLLFLSLFYLPPFLPLSSLISFPILEVRRVSCKAFRSVLRHLGLQCVEVR